MASESREATDYTDIRFVIAAAIGSIAVFLLICAAFVAGPEEMAKTGGINGNLYSGIGLLIVALIMGIWWKMKPHGGASPTGE
ncbi:MAG: LPXTG cell wall anchor domain-containing protein [Ancrocorticia sp.]|uniref:LPXTG cell wall anchor domain-containing protein n=1 Tax=Ancrocorticia sp. TaxID=2593684 RepID=UPI003F8E0BC8